MQDAIAAAGAQVLGISVDTPFAAAAFADKMGLDFPLLGDWPKNDVCKRYGTYIEERSIAARRTFIVDRRGVVRTIIDDMRDVARHSRESLEEAKRLQAEAASGNA